MKTTYKLTYPIFLNLETSNISKLHAKFGFDRTLELTKASVVSLSFLSTIVVQPGSIKTWQFLDISYKTAPLGLMLPCTHLRETTAMPMRKAFRA